MVILSNGMIFDHCHCGINENCPRCEGQIKMEYKYDMANLNKPTPYEFHCEGESLTEQEHKNSCDINYMLRGLALGNQIRMNAGKLQYGEDDVNLTTVEHYIRKQKTEEALADLASSHELTEEELKHVPPKVQEKFKFKTKSKPKNDESNDDKNNPSQSKSINSGPNNTPDPTKDQKLPQS